MNDTEPEKNRVAYLSAAASWDKPVYSEAGIAPAEEREAALYDRFTALGIGWKTQAHAPVFTVQEAQALRGSLQGMHNKNLFLKDKSGGLWLIVAREDLKIDLNALAKILSVSRFSFGSPALLVETLGIAPGAVTPFALMNDLAHRVTAIFDEEMMRGALLHFHPLRNDRTTAIRADDLVTFVRATGHIPTILPLPERAE